MHYQVSNIRNRDWWRTSTRNSSTYDWYRLVYHSTYFSVHLLPRRVPSLVIFYPSIMRIIEYRLSSITSPWKRLIIIENMRRMKVIGSLVWRKKKEERRVVLAGKANRRSESSLNQFPLTEFSFHNAFQVRPTVRIDLKRWTVTEYPRCFISITFHARAIIRPIHMKILRINGGKEMKGAFGAWTFKWKRGKTEKERKEKKRFERSRSTNWYLVSFFVIFVNIWYRRE